jgi:predicted nuclease with RNAse H fold
MRRSKRIVVGIDVGGERKGFHAVALENRRLKEQICNPDPDVLHNWCLSVGATIVAIDAPCGWSLTGPSRQVERELASKQIYCYSTPTRAIAVRRKFCEWVFNGERLYERIRKTYPLFDGQRSSRSVCFETFPHAIVRALVGKVAKTRPKGEVRRQVLRDRDVDERALPNIDFVDAALCAVAADCFWEGNSASWGAAGEGIIVLPRSA